jgi:hypothetical protein
MATRGRFWVLRDDKDESDEELADDPLALAPPTVPVTPTLGDAILQARDLRGVAKQRADRRARHAAMEERLRWKRQEIRDARVISKPIASPSWRYAQVASDRRRDPVSPARPRTPPLNRLNQKSRWIEEIGFELYVVELCRSRRVIPPRTPCGDEMVGRRCRCNLDLPARQCGDSSDDVTIFEEIFVSIRTWAWRRVALQPSIISSLQWTHRVNASAALF